MDLASSPFSYRKALFTHQKIDKFVDFPAFVGSPSQSQVPQLWVKNKATVEPAYKGMFWL
jgi:hypothetical protein